MLFEHVLLYGFACKFFGQFHQVCDAVRLLTEVSISLLYNFP